MKGKLKSFRPGTGGLIIPTPVPGGERDKERERTFAAGAWAPGGAISPSPGMEVEYDIDEKSRKGAINVRPEGVSTEEIASRRQDEEQRRTRDQKRREQQRTYSRVAPLGELFRNPYNFVRPLPDPIVDSQHPETLLLGRCPPPPHDRSVGLSGRLTCRLTTVTATFVSDSHAVEPDREHPQHRTYRFHLVDDEHGHEVPCIPASALRGVIRSTFEAATNSCWEHVAADRRLSRRVVPSKDEKLTPGRVERGDDGKWKLRVMSAAPVPRYVPNAVAIPDGVVHGSRCFADLENGWVRRLYAPADPDLPKRTLAGWYFDTGENANRKKNERFFHDAGTTAVLTETVIESYVLLLADYRERHERQRENNAALRKGQRSGNQPARDSRFLDPNATVPQTVEECEGELVFARVENGTATALSPVSIPRIMYDRSLRDNFPEIDAVKSCSEMNRSDRAAPARNLQLCPACRTFGWVAADDERGAAARAVRSRVRFGAVRFAAGTLNETPRTLEILSAPKPTTLRFYLLPQDGTLAPNDTERDIDYDSERSELRGRKFYRRREQAALDRAQDRTGQNRTLRDHLPPGRSAKFEIVFQNLAPLELGALLWTLELEEGWAHRLGYGKPLGLGAVQIEVDTGEIFTPDRYVGAAACSPLTERARSALRERFRGCMETVHGAAFADLPSIRDLKDILGSPAASPVVMYPHLPAGQEPESYRWFVKNRSPRAGHWLDLADSDAGLPRDPTSRTRPVT